MKPNANSHEVYICAKQIAFLSQSGSIFKKAHYSAVSEGRKKLKPNCFMTLTATVLLVVWLAGTSSLAAEPNVIRVPEDYLQIQLAIDNARSGDIIQVAAGTYFENLIIKKPLKLIGEGPDKTVVAKTGTVIRVEASNVEISGFDIQNGTYGIVLWYSQNVLLENNEMSDNKWNFAVWGDSISHFVHDIDSSNTVDGKPMYFWVNQHGKHVPADAGYVALINSTNITAKNMNLTSNEQGVLLVSTTHSVIENVTMSGNDEGMDIRMSHNNIIRKNRLLSINWRAIYLESSHNNTFYENTILNSTYAVSIQNSSGNTFFYNNFINNKDQVYIEISQNSWHNELLEGNYWSDYIGEDVDGDGVGDTRLPWQGIDYYPLMDIYEQGSSEAGMPLWWIPVVGFGAGAIIIIVFGFWRYKSSRK